MRINWQKLGFHRDRGSLLFAGYFLCIAGIICLYIRFSQPKIKDPSSILIVNGQFQGYNFIDGSRGRHDYTFRLKGYINSFKIKADFLGFFNNSEFKQLQENDELIIGISETDKKRLNSTNSYLFVYSIKGKTKIYLDEKASIKRQNSNSDYYYFIGLILLGLISVHFGYKTKMKINASL